MTNLEILKFILSNYEGELRFEKVRQLTLNYIDSLEIKEVQR